MTDDTRPPDGGGPKRPMWDALNEELRRAVEDGGSPHELTVFGPRNNFRRSELNQHRSIP